MTSKLCCIAAPTPRTGSPDLPNARIPILGRRSSRYEQLGSGSPFSSTQGEEREELQRIFENASGPSEGFSEQGQHRPDHAEESKPAKQTSAVNKLRKQLSRVGSKHLLAFKHDQKGTPSFSEIQGTGNDIVQRHPYGSLLDSGRRSRGGYDPDALSLCNIRTPRSNILRSSVQDWRARQRSSIGSIDWKDQPGLSVM